WQIAVAYEVKIDEIKGLNSLLDNDIYPGNKLLIKKGVVVPTVSSTETRTQVAISTATVYGITLTPTPNVVSSSALKNNTKIMKMVIGIISLAVLGAGIITWLGSLKKK
ncbi:MAG TPA: LysM peptidoglycan-binding domain-containing protein, partial [Anaerolineales bacterium]